MVIDDEEDKKIEQTDRKGEKESQSTKNPKESNESKEPKKTINLKEKPNNSSEQKSKETTGKPDHSVPSLTLSIQSSFHAPNVTSNQTAFKEF